MKVRSDEMTLWVEEEGAVRSSGARKKKETKKRPTTKATKTNDNTGGEVEGETSNSRASGVQVTERDLEALAWIADQYAVRTDVIRWLLGNGKPLSESRTRAVVARWQRAGLAHSRRFFAGAPHVVWPTRAGSALVRPGWRSRPPNLALLAHHHAVSQVRLTIEQRGHGTGWVSERVLYKQRTTPDAHVADGTFRSSRGPVTAVEVELTLKAADRLRDIVRDLTLDHQAVLYVVGDPTIGRAVDTAANSVGEHDRVHVVELARLVIDHA
jgi:hypothetical protein